eukprot:GEMP01004616.1.p1 GENE.GEMP01004616.1~~GEMP01004616.1.p1  ORF type:complete len:1225 (-),score=333.05 GEMP01004616.1:386-4060(-)
MIAANVADGLVINAPVARTEHARTTRATTRATTRRGTTVRSVASTVDGAASERVAKERQSRATALVGEPPMSRTVTEKQVDAFELPLGGPVKDELIMRRVTDLFEPSTENEKVIAAVRSQVERIWGDYSQQRLHVSRDKITEVMEHLECDPLFGPCSPRHAEEPAWASSAGARQIANRQKVMETLQQATRRSPRVQQAPGPSKHKSKHLHADLAEGRRAYRSAVFTDHATLYDAAQRARKNFEDTQRASEDPCMGLPNPHKTQRDAYYNRGELLATWTDARGGEEDVVQKRRHRQEPPSQRAETKQEAREIAGNVSEHHQEEGRLEHLWMQRTTSAELDAYASMLAGGDADKDTKDTTHARWSDCSARRLDKLRKCHRKKSSILSGSSARHKGGESMKRSAEEVENWKALEAYAAAIFGSGSDAPRRTSQAHEVAMHQGRGGAWVDAENGPESSGILDNDIDDKEDECAAAVPTAIEVVGGKESIEAQYGPSMTDVAAATLGKEIAEQPKTNNEDRRTGVASSAVVAANRTVPGQLSEATPVVVRSAGAAEELQQRKDTEALDGCVSYVCRAEAEDTVLNDVIVEEARRRQKKSVRQEERAINTQSVWANRRPSRQNNTNERQYFSVQQWGGMQHDGPKDFGYDDDVGNEQQQYDHHDHHNPRAHHKPATVNLVNGEQGAMPQGARKQSRTHPPSSANAITSASATLFRGPARPHSTLRTHSPTLYHHTASSQARVSTTKHARHSAAVRVSAYNVSQTRASNTTAVTASAKIVPQRQSLHSTAAHEAGFYVVPSPSPRQQRVQHWHEQAPRASAAQRSNSLDTRMPHTVLQEQQRAHSHSPPRDDSSQHVLRTAVALEKDAGMDTAICPKLGAVASPTPLSVENSQGVTTSAMDSKTLQYQNVCSPVFDDRPPRLTLPTSPNLALGMSSQRRAPPTSPNVCPCPALAFSSSSTSALPPSIKSEIPLLNIGENLAVHGGGPSGVPHIAPCPSPPEISRCPPECPYTPQQRLSKAAPHPMHPGSAEAHTQYIEVGIQARPSAITRATKGAGEQQAIKEMENREQVDELAQLQQECNMLRGLCNTKPGSVCYEPFDMKPFPYARDNVQLALCDAAETIRHLELVLLNEINFRSRTELDLIEVHRKVRQQKGLSQGSNSYSNSTSNSRSSTDGNRKKHGSSVERFDPYSVHSTAAQPSHLRCAEPVGGFSMSLRHQIEASQKMKKAWY